MKKQIRIGTRGSELALWQANHIKDLLEKLDVKCSIKIIKTSGDIFLEKSLQQSIDKGFFTKEIEEQLLAKEIDLAVHSLKDLPTFMPNGLQLTATTERSATSDLLLINHSAKLDSEQIDAHFLPLKPNSIVGATSLRRQSLLKRFSKNLQPKLLRGNVPSRIGKLKEKKYDAIILAEAGIKRLKLDLSDFEIFRLQSDIWIPAPAQGILGLQSRIDDNQTNHILKKIHSEKTFQSAFIERELLRRFEGGCHSAFGAWARQLDNNSWHVFLGHENKEGNWKTTEVSANNKETLIDEAHQKMKNILENKDVEPSHSSSLIWEKIASNFYIG